MLDQQILRNNIEVLKNNLERRGLDIDIDFLIIKSPLRLVLLGPETPLKFLDRKCNKIEWDSFFHFSLDPESFVSRLVSKRVNVVNE